MIDRIETPYKWAMMIREPMEAWSKGRVTLLGDACHPTLPFLGQGGVMSIEDGYVVAACLDKHFGEPGMAFVIEPGLYIRQEALDQLPDTPDNRAFREKVAPAVERYKGIGVRIEDSFLLTATELVRLSAKVPRTIQEIDEFMRSRR